MAEPLKKRMSVVIPTYNEQENVPLVYKRVMALFTEDLSAYEPEILFIDNDSADNTRAAIESLTSEDRRVKAILNAKNFGFARSTYYGLTQATGDCAVLLFADMQDPPEVVPEFVREWEKGGLVVVGIKSQSRENKLMYAARSCYYSLLRKSSDVEQIAHYDGFGLYDKSFLDILRSLEDSQPYLRGIVAELAPKCRAVEYRQDTRRHGKTSFNFYRNFDVAMQGITSYTKNGLRFATLSGMIMSILGLLAALVYLVLKICFWDLFPGGSIPTLLAVLVFGSVLLFFVGLLGEYVMSVNAQVKKRPLVVEERRINF